MKKIILLTSLLIVLLLLVGCIPPESSKLCNAPYKKIANKCCMDLNNNFICDSEEKPFQSASSKQLMENFLSALSEQAGYSYKYKQDTYYVYDNLVKRMFVDRIKILSETPVGPKKIPNPFVDVVYFDTIETRAVGFCEGLDDVGERMCNGYQLWDVPVEVEYDTHYRKTPTDWLNEFAGREPKEIKENYRYEVSGIEVTGLVFVDVDKVTILDIDPITGIVWRATVDEDGYITEYQYEHVRTGTGTVAHEYKAAPEKPILSETGPKAIE